MSERAGGMMVSGARHFRALAIFLVAVPAALALLVTGIGTVHAAQQGGRGGGQAAPPNEAARVLDGAIDIHVHSLPDSTPRSIDGFEVAVLARARGMRGIVLKNHYDATAGLAYMVRKQVPGLEVFGGIDLNLPVGGMNAAAVEHMAELAGGWGRFVWMSTSDAENQVRYSKQDRPYVSVSRNGELLPEAKAVIASIARHGLVLASGHVSPEEGLMLFREGKRQGVQHMVMTHAMNAPISATVPQMQATAKEGAFIEFAVGGSVVTPAGAATLDSFAEAMRKIGPEFCIVSTDLGQRGNPLPPDGLAAVVAAYRSRGLTEKETDLMTKQNPATLLGLPVQ